MRNLIFPRISPRWYQYQFWRALDAGTQFNLISWPRRAGKDVTTFSAVVNRALMVPGNYFYYFPTMAWAKRAIWDNVCDWAGGIRLVDLICPPEIQKRKSEIDCSIDLHNGSRIKLGGTDNLDFVGQGGAGYALSEYSLHKDAVTGYLMPILDQSNAWIIANGTMRGKQNPLYALWEGNQNRDNWFTQWYTLEDTKTNYWINEIEDICINPELAGKINPENNRPYKNIQDYIDSGGIPFITAKQEFMNLADGEVEGGYYSYELKQMHRDNRVQPIDPFSDRVYTFWDLGGIKQDSDKTCILFAHINTENKTAKVVDYYENVGHKRGHYFDVLNAKGYDYAGHYFPHDAKRSNEWTGETTADTARAEYGIEVRFIPKTQSVLNDIEVARRGFALTSFSNSSNVDMLIQCLSSYHQKSSTGTPCHQNNCVICNGASHGADTYRYMRMAIHMNLVAEYLKKPRKTYYEELNDYVDYEFVV